MKFVNTIIALASIALLTACASSPKIQSVQIGDENLSKQQIMAELTKLDQTEQQIRGNKGVTGTNVASFLFWLPGLAYTYYDAGEAMKLVEQRRSHLNTLYNKKYANVDSVKRLSKA